MTQVQDFPTTTTTKTKDNFISDDGSYTSTSSIEKITNIYNFMIGSCVLLNDTRPIVLDTNQLRTVTYVRLDKLNILTLKNDYPQLATRFNDHNITQLQQNTGNFYIIAQIEWL